MGSWSCPNSDTRYTSRSDAASRCDKPLNSREFGAVTGSSYSGSVDQSLTPPRPSMDRPVARRRFDRRRRWPVAAVAVAAIGIAAALVIPDGNSLIVDATAVDTGLVARAPFQDYLPLRSEIAPLHSIVLSAVVGGTVGTVDIIDGSVVAKGTALAHLDNPTLRLEVATREVEIASRLTDLSAQELTLRRTSADGETAVAAAANEQLRADHDLTQHQTLFDKGIIAPTALANYQRDATFRRDRLAALRASGAGERSAATRQAGQLASTRTLLLSDLAAVRSELDALVVRAPSPGRLTGFAIQPGQAVKAGDPLGQIDAPGSFKLVGEVDEFYLGRVAPGQAVVAVVDGRTVDLLVDRVLPQVVAGRFKVELLFVGSPPMSLRRGQAVDARITLGQPKIALVAPNGPWLDAGGTTAFVVAADGRHADRRSIAVARRTPEQVEITAGLRPGERIITSGIAAYRTRDRLTLREGSPS